MSRKIIEYLPFLGIVLVICATSWLAGRTLPAPSVTRGRASAGRHVRETGQGRTISR
ncbi:hypothetical protein SAMN05444920_10730 [Nonomuraea solani]|uniref:Uncharacterized protein n=1 Tax=Nonomuraea solani TaxID=1144553 RepID=A0A1H6DYK3_9ACTN|nr:hypothetical protein [Nonomuraea solani]SEG90440.1 hypothetical protein SAMN05444920_10730 [Nonomuraea solani]